LLKNEDLNLQKNGGTDLSETVTVAFNQSNKPAYDAAYNLNHNVFDTTDNWSVIRSKAIKEVVLSQSNRLSNDQLTLDTVAFNGKSGTSVLPPYSFSYIEDTSYAYDKDDANDWGYYKNDPTLWSLEEIETPEGATIEIDYEQHSFRSVLTHTIPDEENEYIIDLDNAELTYEVDRLFDFKVGDVLSIDASFIVRENSRFVVTSREGDRGCVCQVFDYEGGVVISDVNIIDDDTVELKVKLEDDVLDNYFALRSYAIGYSDPSLTTEDVYDDLDSNNNKSFNTINISPGGNDYVYENQGGIRVRDITITDGFQAYTSNYTYGENEDGLGWVTYVASSPLSNTEVPYSSELPPSKPMYEFVTLTSRDTYGNATAKMVYEFNVLTSKTDNQIQFGDFYELEANRSESASNTSGKNVHIDTYEIQDNLGAIGQLLSVSSYNSKDQLLSKLTNEYYSKDELPDNMGVVQESYQTYKQISYTGGDNSGEEHWNVNGSTRVKYPTLLKSSTELKDGVTYTTTFSDFDPISGQAKEVTSSSSLGLEMKTVSEPAFYHYDRMGSKAEDSNNKNMLTQAAETLSYFKEFGSNSWELYGAEVDTWRDWGNSIWRKHKTYSWKGALNANGSYRDFVAFNWNSTTQNEGWQKRSEVTIYNEYSTILETEDINGNKVSKRMVDNNSKVSVVCDAPHNAMVYTDFEYPDDFYSDAYSTQGVYFGDNTLDDTKAHTGKYSLKTNQPYAMQAYLGTPGHYKASVWVHKDNYINTLFHKKETETRILVNSNEIIEAGDWVQLNFSFEVEETSYVFLGCLSGEANFDDFRIHPANSSMTSYVYNEWDELTYVLGSNNMGTQYEYDEAGRLYKTYTEVTKNGSTDGGFKLINETGYNYKNQ